MSALLLDILGTWLRAAAIALSAYLVEHHIVTSGQGDQLSMELARHLALILPAVLALAWGTMKNVWQKRAVLTALMMPSCSTENDLKATIKTGATPSVRTPSDTVPGIPLAALALTPEKDGSL